MVVGSEATSIAQGDEPDSYESECLLLMVRGGTRRGEGKSRARGRASVCSQQEDARWQ
jgi:hypothetical protein